MKKFYQSGSGRSTPESDEERSNDALEKGRINPAFSGSTETIDMRLQWPHPSLEVINEEDTSSDTQSTRSTMVQPTYNIYNPPVSSVDKQNFTRYMLDNVKAGDDMCTDPGCPYNRWLYSGAGFPVPEYLNEWEHDRTRRHFDRLEEIIMSPNKIPHISAKISSDGSSLPDSGSGPVGSPYPVVTLPKSERPSTMSSLCCFGSGQKRRRESQESSEEDHASSLPTLPPPYSPQPPEMMALSATMMTTMSSRSAQEDMRCDSRATVSSCSTCSKASTCSCCRSSEPEDPTAPHAFTLDPAKAAKMRQKRKKKGVAACIPRCNAACCATSTFIIFCLTGLTVVLLYLKFHTSVMNEGMTEM